jgi:hypothetical protein
VESNEDERVGGLVALDDFVGDAGEGAPDVFRGHDYFFRHKKPPASGWQEVAVISIVLDSLASLTGLD